MFGGTQRLPWQSHKISRRTRRVWEKRCSKRRQLRVFQSEWDRTQTPEAPRVPSRTGPRGATSARTSRRENTGAQPPSPGPPGSPTPLRHLSTRSSVAAREHRRAPSGGETEPRTPCGPTLGPPGRVLSPDLFVSGRSHRGKPDATALPGGPVAVQARSQPRPLNYSAAAWPAEEDAACTAGASPALHKAACGSS